MNDSEPPSKPLESKNEWPEWAATLNPRIADRQQALFYNFAKFLRDRSSSIWQGLPTAQAELTPQRHQDLRDALRKTASNANAELTLMNWWDRLIVAGNQDGRWEIPLLPPIARLPPTQPVFVRRDFQLLAEFRKFEAALTKKLAAPMEQGWISHAAFLSAIIFGGVSSKETLESLLKTDCSAVTEFGGELRIELRFEKKNQPTQYKAWFPDAVTSSLIARLIQQTHGLFAENLQSPSLSAEGQFEAAVAHLDLPQLEFSLVLRAARVASALRVPPYIVAYLNGELVSQSLPRNVWQRLNGWKVETGPNDQREQPDQHAEQFTHLVQPQIFFDPITAQVDQLKIISAIRKTLTSRTQPIESIDGILREYGTAVWPIVTLLTRWTQWHLGGNNENDEIADRKGIKRSSAMRYLSAIARHLIPICHTENPLEMDTDDFETLYELGSARVVRPKEKQVYWLCVKSFHTYLMLAGAPDVNMSELDGYISGGNNTVSANLIGESDFQLFKKALMPKNNAKIDTPSTRVFLAAVLGFRCGLRRREAQMIQLKDVHSGPHPCLLVRSSRLAQLKSFSAHRRIPLRHLLPDDELHLFLAYVDQRRSALMGDNGLVFSWLHTPTTPMGDRDLFEPITACFQAIQGLASPRFRYHHLRHSFANWVFMALVASDAMAWPRKNSGPLSASPFDSHRMISIKNLFFPRRFGTDPTPTRKNLYLTSALLGHLSPATTTQSYLHLIDWIAAQELDDALDAELENVGSGFLGSVCGLSPSMPHKPPYRKFRNKPTAFLRCFVHQQLAQGYGDSIAPSGEQPELSEILKNVGKISIPPPNVLMLILARLQTGTPVETLERVYCVPHEVIASAADYYKRMYAKQSTATPKKRIRLPGPPRPKAYRETFFAILSATVNSFNRSALREELVIACRLFVQRNGPGTGRIYFGERQEHVLTVLKALAAMGITEDLLEVNLRIPSPDYELRPEIAMLEAEILARGIPVNRIGLDWELREMKNEVFRITVGGNNNSGFEKSKFNSTAIIHGLNYAALWILFAKEFTQILANSSFFSGPEN